MTPQETHAAVVSLLQQQGLPMTTANLNRGMLALAQNDMNGEGAALPAVSRSMDRTMGTAPQAASPQPLPVPPIPPTAAQSQQPPQQVAPTTLELNTPGQLPAGVRNSIEAFLTNGSTQQARPAPVPQTVPDGSASSLVDAPRPPTLERSAPPDNLYNYGADEQAVHVPTVERMAPQANMYEGSDQPVRLPTVAGMTPPANLYNADVAGMTPDMLAIEGVPGANVYNADSANKAPSIPKEPGRIMSGINSAVKYAQDALTMPPREQQPFSLETMGEDIRAGRIPNPNPDLPLILFGTGPVGAAARYTPAMQQFMRQRVTDIMGQNGPRPSRPPSTMLNQAGDGFEEALAARTQAGQRSSYKGEGVDNFIKGGNVQTPSASAPASSVKTNTPTWRGESDPSTPMATRNTPSTPSQSNWKGEGDPSAPMGTRNTAAPHTPSQDTSGAGAAIKQSLTKRKQMAASKSTRKSKD